MLRSADVEPGRPRHDFPLLLVLFFASGAAGLVYQVLWLRLLTLAFGTTTFAVSTLLTSFMAGLGLGSELSGRLLARRGRALLRFGLFEIGIGLYALTLPGLLPLVQAGFAGAVGGVGLSLYGESLLRLVMSILLLLPPTALMGATLPLLAQHTVERFGHLGIRVGSLYGLNTLGAATGCFAAGFYAIAHFGVRGTTMAAAALNAVVGMAAIALDRRGERPPGGGPEPARPGSEAPPLYGERVVRGAMWAFAFSGFVALGLEVAWTRLLTLVFTGYTYSFSTMLTVLLFGIAAGSLAFGRRADRSPDPLRLFGLLEVAIGLTVLCGIPLFLQASDWVEWLGAAFGRGWIGYTAAKFVVGFLLLILPTFGFGATFPVVSRLAARSLAGIGATVGRLYAANVAGAILGAFATGFVLLPAVGVDLSLRTLGAALLMLGVILILASPSARKAEGAVAALAGAAVALAVVVLGPPDVSRAIHQRWLKPGERLAFYREGVEATVMVGEPSSAESGLGKRILVNGSSASNSGYFGLSVNRIQGSLPFLFERPPRKVLAICFGTGITFGTLAQFDVERVDGVEISPDVLRAAPRFAVDNYDVVHDPRVRLHIDDGRNFLLKSRERYDVITMEPMPPALAGVANFYTRDFYALCRRRLEPGGLVSQWVPLYYLGLEDVRMLYRTFAESFPHVLVFCSLFDTFLVGSDRPLDLEPSRFRDRLRSARLSRDLELIGLGSPERMLASFLMGGEALRRFSASAPVLSDDVPYVEFTGPRWAGLDFLAGNVKAVYSLAESPAAYLKVEAEGGGAEVRAALEAMQREALARAYEALGTVPPR